MTRRKRASLARAPGARFGASRCGLLESGRRPRRRNPRAGGGCLRSSPRRRGAPRPGRGERRSDGCRWSRHRRRGTRRPGRGETGPRYLLRVPRRLPGRHPSRRQRDDHVQGARRIRAARGRAFGRLHRRARRVGNGHSRRQDRFGRHGGFNHCRGQARRGRYRDGRLPVRRDRRPSGSLRMPSRSPVVPSTRRTSRLSARTTPSAASSSSA